MIPSGDYAVIRGEMFRLDEGTDGVMIYSAHPPEWLSGWSPTAIGSGYRRIVSAAEVDHVVRVSYRGSYRGIRVEVEPEAGQKHLLLTREMRAGLDAGFSFLDREMVVKEVMRDDPDLTVEQHRRVVPFPSPIPPTSVEW